MLYNDEASRDFEKHFQQDLETARSFNEAEIKKLKDGLEKAMTAIESINAKPNKTTADLEALSELKERLNPIQENLKAITDVLGHNLLMQATAYYEHVKKLAAEGNEKAKEIYEKLKPGYQAMLKENLNNQMQ